MRHFLSAWEALSWIAFKEIRSTIPADDFKALVVRWGDDSPPRVLEALKARAAPQPYCVLDAFLEYDGLDQNSYRSRAFSRGGPGLLRRVMWEFRRREGRWGSPTELVLILEAELAAQTRAERRFNKGRQQLMKAIRDSRVTMWARKGRRSDAQLQAVPVRVIPREYIVTDQGNLECEQFFASPTVFSDSFGSDAYFGVQFFCEEILRWWPPPVVGRSSMFVDIKALEPDGLNIATGAVESATRVPRPASCHKRFRAASGGRPPAPHIDAFWIEVAILFEPENRNPSFRPVLQKIMERWANENSKNGDRPLYADDTIREKLSLLYRRVSAENRPQVDGKARLANPDAFWIEVVVWLENNGKDPALRSVLQQEMVKQVIDNSSNPHEPLYTEEIIDKKLGQLYQRAARKGQDIAMKSG
jgi:hypothetical protein